MNKPTEEEIEVIENTEIHYRKAKQFFHCKGCIEQFMDSELHDVMTPREYGLYEISSYDFKYPNGEIEEIVVVWCKRCGKRIWDGRDTTKLY